MKKSGGIRGEREKREEREPLDDNIRCMRRLYHENDKILNACESSYYQMMLRSDHKYHPVTSDP
jgi:hypothetical protein